MKAHLAAMAVVLAALAPASAQTIQHLPGTLCADGTDPRLTHLPCAPVAIRNAVDEGRVSTTLPRSVIVIPNDPLGHAIGGGAPMVDQYSTFGNRGIQLQKIR